MSGFGWDDGRKLVTAADEQWNELAQVHSRINYWDSCQPCLSQRDSQIKKWKTTPFPLYDEMHSLVDGVVATGSGAFQAGALLTPKPSQLVIHKEPSIEWTNSQSTGCATPPRSPSEQNTVRCLNSPSMLPLISTQADANTTMKSEVGIVPKKRQRSSNTPEPSRLRKHRRQQQQDNTQGLITEMARVVQTLCSSLQPASNPLQSPQQRKTAAIKLMEGDGDFKKSECIPVIRLFTSSIVIVDSYLAIEDQEVRTMYIKRVSHFVECLIVLPLFQYCSFIFDVLVHTDNYLRPFSGDWLQRQLVLCNNSQRSCDSGESTCYRYSPFSFVTAVRRYMHILRVYVRLTKVLR